MARQADVRRVALSLPETVEAPSHFAFSVRNKGKLKGFVWVWMERVTPRRPACRSRTSSRCGSRASPTRTFCWLWTRPSSSPSRTTTDSLAVLVRLPAVTARELKPIVTEAWRCQAPKDLDTKHKTSRRRVVGRARRAKG